MGRDGRLDQSEDIILGYYYILDTQGLLHSYRGKTPMLVFLSLFKVSQDGFFSTSFKHGPKLKAHVHRILFCWYYKTVTAASLALYLKLHQLVRKTPKDQKRHRASKKQDQEPGEDVNETTAQEGNQKRRLWEIIAEVWWFPKLAAIFVSALSVSFTPALIVWYCSRRKDPQTSVLHGK